MQAIEAKGQKYGDWKTVLQVLKQRMQLHQLGQTPSYSMPQMQQSIFN
jgi:hypothetical protein